MDLLAEGVDQLMFLKGDKVAVLECLDLEKGVYLVRSPRPPLSRTFAASRLKNGS